MSIYIDVVEKLLNLVEMLWAKRGGKVMIVTERIPIR